MAGLLGFEENIERKHLSSIYELMLDRSFNGRSEFDHMFMSAGEGLGRSLEYLNAVEWQGSSIILKMSKQNILRKLEEAPAIELPLITDVLDVLLTFLGQYARVPKLTNPFMYADFDSAVLEILREMRLLDGQYIAHRSLWLFLVDHYFLMPAQGGWNENVRHALKSVCEMTLASAPEEFKAIIEGRSDRPVSWAEGYLSRSWRQGHWLTEQEEARSIGSAHSFLPVIVCHTLMNPSKEVYVP
ncbi:MAG: hypothetical protein ABJM43_04185 [Paracoccaceae bacterium]